MTANFVARETGYEMRGWGHGDRTTQEHFSAIETFPERFEDLARTVRMLGFHAVDIWGGHLNQAWATDEHLAVAGDVIARYELSVTSYATYVGEGEAERVCEIATALGTRLLGGLAADLPGVAPILREHEMLLGIENHPEKTPAELLAKIREDPGVLGATIDTGWWATQGYDAARAIEELAPHVLHVHLKDVLETGAPHETCRWGDGIVPIERCIDALRSIGYDGAITIEHEPETYDPTDDIWAMREELEEWLA
ncbi:MAG: hypothetical protein QOF43_159 [Gaiellaceae bacterium]|nr:hypothetical protein [Gaiellaceae bacterium]